MNQPIFSASAPGKVILMGEHAVVYGRPAMAVPIQDVRATATFRADANADTLWIDAIDVHQRVAVASTRAENPLARAAQLTFSYLQLDILPGELTIHSTIPLAGGLGSGAAVSTAIVRVLSQATGHSLEPAEISDIVFEVEKLHHSTPSGVDNAVIAYECPVWFIKGKPPEPFEIANPFWLVIADTGIASPTRETVGDVRRAWQADPQRYEQLFDAIGALVARGREAMLTANWAELGQTMRENHAFLAELGVSSPLLDRLVDAACQAGAYGAKLSGGGRGGNVIALVDIGTAPRVADAFRELGVKNIIMPHLK